MFLGSFKYSIDAKGRLAIPAKLRKSFNPEANDTVIINQGKNNCIEVFPADRWNKLMESMAELNTFDQKKLRLVRMFSQNASDCTLDSQSRILIPPNLLEYAHIEKESEVLILGTIKTIEIWNPVVYAEYMNESDSYEDLAAEIFAKV